MTKDAVVTKLLPKNMAEVAAARSSACGGSCGSCDGCFGVGEVKAVADNSIGAKPGQKVVIESGSTKIFGAALLVYIMPLALFLLGYILAYLAGAAERLCILTSFLGLAVGALILVKTQKNRKEITYKIIQIKYN